MKNMLSRELSGVANNSGFVFSNRTSVPYKGFRKGRRWNLEMKDLEALEKINGLEVVAANNSRWGKTIIFEEKKFDVKPYIKGDWYGHLKDTAYFKAVTTDGYTVTWPDGQDICPDELYLYSYE